MRMTNLIAGLALALIAALPARALEEVRLQDGRFYLIEVPKRVAHPPLILALHGGGGNPGQFASDSGLTAKALAAGFAIAYPAGSARLGKLRTWNAGHCCAYAARQGIDDIAFLDRVRADAGARFGVDAEKVYLTGMSNGSMMALAYAAERPGQVAALASAAGVLDLRRHKPTGPVPVLHLHGTADDRVPFGGGTGTGAVTKLDYPSVPAMMAAWVKAARRPLTQHEAFVDPAEDGMRVRVTTWSDAVGRPFVKLLAVEGGGHAWPGGRRSGRRGATRDAVASDEVIRFFEAWR